MQPVIDKPYSQYPDGTRVISIQGETSDTDTDQDVFTGPNAFGVISQVLTDQKHCYSVDFPLGVSVFLSPSEIADSNRYQIVPMTLHNVFIQVAVRIQISNVEAYSYAEAVEKAESPINLDDLFGHVADLKLT